MKLLKRIVIRAYDADSCGRCWMVVIRHRKQQFPVVLKYPMPASDIVGKRILVHVEAGFADFAGVEE